MLANYFSIAIRNIRNHPLYAFINVISLALGLSASAIIYLFIEEERSFDSFNTKRSIIYRLDEIQNFTGTNLQKVALSMPGMGPHMREDFPEVLNYTRFWNHNTQVFIKGDQKILIENVRAVDSTFLDIFDFPLIAGNKDNALDEPNTVILTRETAAKFFPNAEAALGNSITIVDEEFKITGILEDIPENSHLQFDALLSIPTFVKKDPTFNNRWGSNFLNTYLVIQPGADIKALEKKFPDFMVRHTGKNDINDFYTLYLQKLEDVHLASNDIEHDYNNYRKFNGKYLDTFAIIGLFIILIAGVNFMNLTTARASHRWKEIGVRKTVGAQRFQLIAQFIFESVFMAVMALLVSVLISIIFIPPLNGLIGRHLSFLTILSSSERILILVLVTIGLGIMTGIYPALYLTSFKLARIFKGGGQSEGKSVFQSTLVVIQFALALGMIVSTLVVLQQLNFMQKKDIGFEKDQILLIKMNKEANEKFQVMKTELLSYPEITGVTASGQRIGNNFHQWGFNVKADTGIVNITPSNVNVDYDYLKVYGIKLKQGRDFSKEFAGDNGRAFIINEMFAKELNIKDVIGTPAGHSWYADSAMGSIIGVTEDFNFNSLHYKINTLSLVVHPDWGYDEMSVKIGGRDVEATIALLKNTWDKHISSFPFSYSFLDDHFAQLYQSDKQMSAVVSIMAGLAILISCMGLFGLAAILTEKKTKEIGIRKVLGATEGQITFLLSKQFFWLVVISFVVITPIAYWLLSEWLQTFAYRITINPLLFIAGGLVALGIALTTISYHTIRSARSNPVNTLRYE